MTNYQLPSLSIIPMPDPSVATLIANGDLRLAANQICWPAQQAMEQQVVAAFAREGITVNRGHAYDPQLKHGFIWNQRMGMDVFKHVHPEARLIIAESVWQYSHHLLAGLRDHRGPILTVCNWSGEWPGLVGLLNLNASLTKMGVPYSTIWSVDFTDDFFLKGIRQWIAEGKISHDTSHVHDLNLRKLPLAEAQLGQALAQQLKQDKAIFGVFDEGCMGMYNAIIDDELMNPTGIYKERLSQSSLVAQMYRVGDAEAQHIRDWLDKKGMRFNTGKHEETYLTDHQILEQCKMYIGAVRIAHDFGCSAIGIQYQQGLKDLVPASDLVEGLLNNVDRPPVYHATTGQELYAGQPLPIANEVDEGCAMDLIVTNRVWTAMGLDPATTLHDLRWGEHYQGGSIDDFVWVFEISGAVPPSHLIVGCKRPGGPEPPTRHFPLGGVSSQWTKEPVQTVRGSYLMGRSCVCAVRGSG